MRAERSPSSPRADVLQHPAAAVGVTDVGGLDEQGHGGAVSFTDQPVGPARDIAPMTKIVVSMLVDAMDALRRIPRSSSGSGFQAPVPGSGRGTDRPTAADGDQWLGGHDEAQGGVDGPRFDRHWKGSRGLEAAKAPSSTPVRMRCGLGRSGGRVHLASPVHPGVRSSTGSNVATIIPVAYASGAS